MLGRSYSLAGRVIRGDQVGRKLGFPTANLDVRGLVLPPVGVYAAHASCAGERWRAVVNLGFRPTRAGDSPSLQLEAHLLDYHGDLYGQELELTFVEKLRDEQRFDSLDIEEARRLFAG
jgi:riboflavin kinase/FMN adenylyltransferase